MAERNVSKFGGTSMAHPEIPAAIVEAREDHGVIVVSAPGREPGIEDKVTDQLYAYAGAIYHEDDHTVRILQSTIVGRFESIYERHIGSKTRQYLTSYLAHQLEPRPGLSEEEAIARYASIGEMASARYFAELIGGRFVDSRFIRFKDDGQLSRADTNIWLCALIKEDVFEDENVVVPGFYGYNAKGNRRLLARGGSDRTGAIIANTLAQAPNTNILYENWTDRDGIYTADPTLVTGARVIPELSREELREGAYGGSGILQGDAIVDLNSSDIVTVVRNTFNTAAPGTKILPSREAKDGESIVAITGRDDLTEITIRDMGMADSARYLGSLTTRFGDLGLSFEHVPSSRDSFSITTVAKTAEQIAAVEEFVDIASKQRITQTGSVEVSPKGIVYVVGEGLRNPTTRSMALHRIMGVILGVGQAVEDVISNNKSPSQAFLVQPKAVSPIIRAIHRHEIEKIGSVMGHF